MMHTYLLTGVKLCELEVRFDFSAKTGWFLWYKWYVRSYGNMHEPRYSTQTTTISDTKVNPNTPS